MIISRLPKSLLIVGQSRRGFALPAVLAVTGVVTLIFLVAITAIASLTAEAAAARSRSLFLQRAMTAEATIQFLAATEPMKTFGFQIGVARYVESAIAAPPSLSEQQAAEVRLDGRVYRMDVAGPLAVRLQDEAGLVNLPYLGGEAFRRFVEQVGIPPAMASTLEARYVDYVDPDDLRQPSGAERGDYGVNPPANRQFVSPKEWASVLGVREAMDARKWRAVLPDLAADTTTPSVNINTATPRALMILFGLTADQARIAVEHRNIADYGSLAELGSVSGAVVSTDFERPVLFPSGQIILDIRDTRSPWVYRARLGLTPNGLEQPVWIDQTELIQAPRRAMADISNATELPYTPR